MTTPIHPACMPPLPDEGPASWRGYLALCPSGDVRELLLHQADTWRELLAPFAGTRDHWSYAPGKWSLARLVGHMADGDLVLLERLLRAARGDSGPQPAYDEDAFAAQWEPGLEAELRRLHAQRALVVDVLRRLPEEAWSRPGQVEDRVYSVRQVAWMMLGHGEHHLRVARERYLPGLDPPAPRAMLRLLPAAAAESVLTEEGIQGWRLGLDGPRRIVRVVLQPGASLPPHPVPDRALFWVASGEGELEVEGQRHLLRTGDAALVEGTASRAWRVVGDRPLDLRVVRDWPRG